jgi:hypothetical protein
VIANPADFTYPIWPPFEELQGPHATPVRSMVLFANAPWLLMPIATAVRMWSEQPFSRARTAE